LERVQLGPGEVLFNQGDAASTGLFAIVMGELSILENGVEMRTMGPGQVLGERAMHDTAARRTASAVARGETVLAKLSTRAYMQLNESKARGGAGASKLTEQLSMDVGLVLSPRGHDDPHQMETLEEADEPAESGAVLNPSLTTLDFSNPMAGSGDSYVSLDGSDDGIGTRSPRKGTNETNDAFDTFRLPELTKMREIRLRPFLMDYEEDGRVLSVMKVVFLEAKLQWLSTSTTAVTGKYTSNQSTVASDA
jgi:hypothetical protein